MPTGRAVTLSEYLATSYRPDCEYVDGELLERNVGEWDHSRLQSLVSCYLCEREKQWRILVAIAPRIRVAATRFRVPDISVLTGPPPDGGIIVEPPFLCIEILSPSDRMMEMQERIDDYLAFGVRYVWLLHPRTRRAFVYSLDSVRDLAHMAITDWAKFIGLHLRGDPANPHRQAALLKLDTFAELHAVAPATTSKPERCS